MPVFDKFLGVSRAFEPHALPDGLCVASLNQRPGRPDLRAWNETGTDANTGGYIPANIGNGDQEPAIYRVRNTPTAGIMYGTPTYASFMQGFDDPNAEQNVYMTGIGKPRQIAVNSPAWAGPVTSAMKPLGIPAPTSAPQIEIVTQGTQGDPETVFFCYTIVAKGRESAPSPVAGPFIIQHSNATFRFTFPLSVSTTGFVTGNGFDEPYYTYRFYRTQAGYSSSAFYHFHVADVPVWLPQEGAVVSQVSDIEGQGGYPPGFELATDGWTPPPEDGHHITLMWGGMASMLSKRTVRICEPGVAYAWPKKNTIPLAFEAISQAVWQQTLVVGTNGKPYAIQGQDPGSLSSSLVELNASCISHKSMVSVGHGVVWSSPTGLAYVGDRGPGIITAGVIPPEVWVREFYPSTIVGAAVGSTYFAFYNTGTERRGFCIDTRNPAAGIMPLSAGYRAAYTDPHNELMFVLTDTSAINVWDASNTSMQASARSKEWLTDAPQTFQAIEVIGTGPARIKIFADGATIFDRDCTPGKYYRFKSKAASRWQVEAATTQNVQAVVLGRIDAFGNLVP